MKRLAAVEIDPSLSQQHEFNAGMLRRELGSCGEPVQRRDRFPLLSRGRSSAGE